MYDLKLNIAYEKSAEVLNSIEYDHESMVDTSTVLQYVQQHYCPTIYVQQLSFDKLGINKRYGAMMLIELSEAAENIPPHPIKASIILNGDTDESFQRFSLMHELGHLVAFDAARASFVGENYVISTHIDYKVNNLSKEEYENDPYLLNEQIANIFSLRVLMPSDQFYPRMEKYNDISEVAKSFGVTTEAVMSRMRIGA